MEPKLALYYSKYCFFCQKVLMFLRDKDHDLDLRSTSDGEHAQALMQGGGKTQVPCLRIEQAEGGVEWLYESDDIIGYLS
jgi:glutathione S-transferase